MTKKLTNVDLESLETAQEIIYNAWEAPNVKKAITLAKKALKVSPYCGDAYNLLADLEAKTFEERLAFYQKAEEVGEVVIRESGLEDDEGYFWGLLETRPYMRTLEGLANVHRQLNNKGESIRYAEKMLRLNPNDNQGVRYSLLALLIENNQDADAMRLVKQYEDDCMAVWKYCTALLKFRESGDSLESQKCLKDALKNNPHVPKYLTGKTKLPAQTPPSYGFGTEEEAIIASEECINAWSVTPKAVDWLASQL